MGSIETVAEEEIISKIKSLGNREIREVMDFIDFIREKEGAEPFIRYIKEKADREITLAQVRQELSSIKGNLLETIVCTDARFCEINRLNCFHVINPKENGRIAGC